MSRRPQLNQSPKQWAGQGNLPAHCHALKGKTMLGEWLTVNEVFSRHNTPKKNEYTWNADGTCREFMRIGKHMRCSVDALCRWEPAHMATQDNTA